MQLLDKIEAKETYQALKRSLQRQQGFGLFFVICTPSQKQEITKQLQQDLGSRKHIQDLTLREETPQLYSKIKQIQQNNPVDILLISGIEKSLNTYVKSGTEASSDLGGKGGYYQLDLASLPHLLTHLNLERENYKKSFPFVMVFFLSLFAYRFMVRRAPDFFDWRSGIFEFSQDQTQLEQELALILEEKDYSKYLSWTLEERRAKIVELPVY